MYYAWWKTNTLLIAARANIFHPLALKHNGKYWNPLEAPKKYKKDFFIESIENKLLILFIIVISIYYVTKFLSESSGKN